MHDNIKRLPYGISNFVEIRERNFYYVDKTMYLPLVENDASVIMFIRPRRFGKSSFVSMMKAYYDKKMEGRFEELFGDLYIGSHPTPERHSYQVLHLDFSRVGGNASVLEQNFNEYCNIRIEAFIEYYRADYPEHVIDKVYAAQKAVAKLNVIQTYASELGIRLYLIIDEYDNFTNVVLNEEGHDIYYQMTHASGFYRDVFKVYKGMFTRIFLTGVSPVTLDDLTSGFNIGTNQSLAKPYNAMLGLSTSDVRAMIEYYRDVQLLPHDIDVEATMEDMRPWYDNYCFSRQSLNEERIFNTDMVLYYLHKFMTSGEKPDELIDPNTRTDYGKMRRLINLDHLEGDRKGIIMQIAENGEILSELKDTFPANQITKPDTFVSLLYYYGMLTIKESMGSMLLLSIPNNNVRKQYYEYMLEIYQEHSSINSMTLAKGFYDMAYKGLWTEVMQYIAQQYKANSSVRSSIEGERNVQGFFTALLSLNSYYLLAPEMEFSHGYCDLFLMPDHRVYRAEHSYIIELKYLPAAATPTKAEAQWAEAVEQIEGYAADARLQAMLKGTKLHKIIVQMQGVELHRLEEV